MKTKHLIDLEALSTEELMEIIALANDIRENPAAYAEKVGIYYGLQGVALAGDVKEEIVE